MCYQTVTILLLEPKIYFKLFTYRNKIKQILIQFDYWLLINN